MDEKSVAFGPPRNPTPMSGDRIDLGREIAPRRSRPGRIMRPLLLGVSLLFALPGSAHADVCDSSGLSGKYLSRCKRDLERCASYRGSAVKPCEKRAVNNAAAAARRDAARDKRSGGASECTADSYTRACFALKERRDKLCKRSMLVRFGSYEAAEQQAEADQWRAKLRSFKSLAPEYAAFKSKYRHCADARGVRCSLPANQSDPCAAATATYVKAWADYVDDFDKNRIAEMKRELAKVKRQRGATVTGWNKTMDRGVREIGHIAKINRELAWLGGDQGRIDRLGDQARKLHAEVEAIYRRRIANVRCPRPKVKGGLTARLRRVMVDHLAGLEKRGTGMKETVVKFGLMGRARTKREPHERLTHEDIPASACVRQVKPDRTACRIFAVTLRRTKPDGGSWSAWRFFSIGGGELMACKNLR